MSGDADGPIPVSEGTELWLVRHGETEWSRDHKHTSHTDLPLTDKGEDAARALESTLSAVDFVAVYSSPLQRAVRTAELGGFGEPVLDDDLVEWDYGEYEGIASKEIREHVPGWSIFTHPAPGGETADDVTERLDRFIARAGETEGRVLVFAHGHSLRALASRWIDEPVSHGRTFLLDTATVSVLGWERDVRVVSRWNSPVG